ncbi:MAG: 50S ribosomal protein L21 [Patescibacteria group bacterium]
MFAIIETGGKQYKVMKGEKIRVEKLNGDAGSPVSFEQVLLKADGESVEIGKPIISEASVTGVIKEQGRADKKIVFKYHSKTRYKKMKGHRQHFTEVEITKI